MATHTPGPWSVFDVLQGGPATHIVVGPEPERIIVAEASLYRDKNRANARLIAAAPELLAALENLLRETSDGTDICGRDFVDAARATIAKARG